MSVRDNELSLTRIGGFALWWNTEFHPSTSEFGARPSIKLTSHDDVLSESMIGLFASSHLPGDFCLLA